MSSRWTNIPLVKLVDAPIVYGIVQPGPEDPDGVPFVQTRDIGTPLSASQLNHTSPAIAATYRRSEIREDDLLVALRGDIGSTAVVPKDLSGANISRGVARLRVSRSAFAPYVLQVLQSGSVRRAINRASRGSTLREISIASLRAIELPLPPLPEQHRIAETLRTWDDAIHQLDTVRAKTRIRHSALASRLTVPPLHDAWPEARLADIATRITRRHDGKEHEVMTIASRTGFVSQSSKYVRDMAGKSLETYTLLRQGEFAYNKGNSTAYPQGCIYPLDQPSALVPSVYVSFALDDSLNHRFYAHFFASGNLNPQLAQRITSSVRGNGLLNITPAAFLNIWVPRPPRAVQDEVARVLDASQQELALLDREIELLRAQKRGLLQKLLSGDVRVPMGDGGVA